ncbi:MAG: DUF2889 domain-containing protein [Candidatus Rokubacteria bacterium]|nr:DUF2889 domain-containing protein [Candidatus Rokubacteria bacterium]
MITPSVLAGRARYERVMDGWTDNTHDDAFTHTVRLVEPERTVELSAVALPSPEYVIRDARARAEGDVDPAAVAAIPRLAGVRMVGGLTRAAAEAVGRGPGGALLVDAVVEVARLARQVAKLPRDQAERASGGAAECWTLDTTGWIDLPDSCFTYSAAGRALLGTRTVVSPMQPDLYSPRPGQTRVFVRRKVARVERVDGTLRLFHSMHDNVHGFDLTYEIDATTGRITRAESVTSRLPYAGICSEPQGRIKALVGETVDAGLRKRVSGLVGGASGCAQLFDLTADVLKLLA